MRAIISFAIVSLFAVSAVAVPLQLTHQGRLLDSSDQPLTGTQTVTFTLWDASTGGNVLWSDALSVTFDNGYYSVTLGDSSNPIDETPLDNAEVWMSLTINSEELLPRQRVNSVPYALVAGAAETAGALDGYTLSDFRLVTQNIDWSELDNVPADADTLAGLTCDTNDVVVATSSGWDCVPGSTFDTWLTEAQVEQYVTNEAINLFSGSQVNGVAISVEGHGHAFGDISGTADSITSEMIPSNEIRGIDLSASAVGAITVSVVDRGADAYCLENGTIKGNSSYGWSGGDTSGCVQAAIDYHEAFNLRRVALLAGGDFELTVPIRLDSDIELVGIGGHGVQTVLTPAPGFTGGELITVDGAGAGVWIHGLQLAVDIANVNGIGMGDVESFVIEDNLMIADASSGITTFIRWDPTLAMFEGAKKVIRDNGMRSLSDSAVSGYFLRIDKVTAGNVFISGLEVLDNNYNTAISGGNDMVMVNSVPTGVVTLAYANIHGNVFDTNSDTACNEAMLFIDGESIVRYSTVTNNRVAGAQLANLLGHIAHSTFANNIARARACQTIGTGSNSAISANASYGLTILGNHTTDYDNRAYQLNGCYAAIIANNVDQNSNGFVQVIGGAQEISIKDNGFYSLCNAHGNTNARTPVYVTSDCNYVAVRDNLWRMFVNCGPGDLQGVDWSAAAPPTYSVLNQTW